MRTFTLNGTTYRADDKTASLLEDLITDYRVGKISDRPICAVLELGLAAGRVERVHPTSSMLARATAQDNDPTYYHD